MVKGSLHPETLIGSELPRYERHEAASGFVPYRQSDNFRAPRSSAGAFSLRPFWSRKQTPPPVVADEGAEGDWFQQSRETVFTVEDRIYDDVLSGEPMLGANPFTLVKRLWLNLKGTPRFSCNGLSGLTHSVPQGRGVIGARILTRCPVRGSSRAIDNPL